MLNFAGYKVGVYGGDIVCNKLKENESIVNSISGEETPVFTFIGQAGSFRNHYPDVVEAANIQQEEQYYYNETKFDRDIALKKDYGCW